MTKAALPKPPARSEEGFILPHNLEAERSSLGAAILHQSAADHICDSLTPDAYFRRSHREIYAAIKRLRELRTEIDLVTLKNDLQRAGKLEEVGGPLYLSTLIDGVPRSSNVEYYAGILKDLHAKRTLAGFANQTLDLVAAGEHSASAMLVDTDRRLMDLQAGHTISRMQSVRDSFEALFDDLEWRVQHKGQLIGISTGFKSIDELTLGWLPADVIVIAARPSIGKTTFTFNSGLHAALNGKRVAAFSLEMRRQQLEYRFLAQLSGIPLMRMRSGYLSESQWPILSAALAKLKELQIFIDDRSGQTVWDIRAACRRLKAEGGLDLVIIDYVQLMPGTLERRGATRNDEVTDISKRLKHVADEINVPILLVSQLSRDNEKREDRRPRLSDLRESGALEQDADLVCFLHRKNHREGGVTNFILEKQRNGPTGTLNLTLDRDITTFTDGGDDTPAPTTSEPEERELAY